MPIMLFSCIQVGCCSRATRVIATVLCGLLLPLVAVQLPTTLLDKDAFTVETVHADTQHKNSKAIMLAQRRKIEVADTPNLYRVILQVSDLDKAVEFYSNLLNAKGRRIRGGRHYFDCGSVILALLDPTSGGQKAKPNPDHIYFSVNDLEKVHARAAALGCLSKEQVDGGPGGEIVKRPWGERSFYAADPFGNRLCFVDARTIFTGK